MSAAPEAIDQERPAIAKPEHILEEIWHRFYEPGNSVAALVLDAFDVYGSGNFGRWEKDRARNMFWSLCKLKEKDAIEKRNRVFEYILVERMKEKEFFCCSLCQESFFNYKQALIHLFSPHHNENIAPVLDSRITGVMKLITTFTELPVIFSDADSDNEMRRVKEEFASETAHENMRDFEGNHSGFFFLFSVSGAPKTGTKAPPSVVVATQKAVDIAKSELGRHVMSELHEFLGQNQSCCFICCLNTVDKEDFYAHYMSFHHLRRVAKYLKTEKGVFGFDPLTTLVNVHKKDQSSLTGREKRSKIN